jgi:uncharacterized protein DUF1573
MNKMTAKLIFGVSIAFAAMAGRVAAADQAATGPKIQFETPVYDFGKVKSGDPVKYTFIFTNAGDELLILTNVQPSCGCTTAGEWSHQVEPGKTGTIPVQFNSANYNGQVLKTVTVTSNDKTQPSLGLQLKGTVWKPIEVNPQFAALNVPAESLEPARAEVKIVNNMEEPLDVWAPEVNSKAFTAELKTNTLGKEYSVTISTVPPLEAGNVQATVTLKSTSTNMQVINITAWANVQAVVVVNPPQITLPAGPLAAKQTAAITIQNNGTNALKLTDAAFDVKGVDVAITESAPGKMFTATLTFPEGFQTPTNTPVAFSVKSNHPRFSIIKVPVIQMPRPVVPLAPPVSPHAAAAPTQPGKPAVQ